MIELVGEVDFANLPWVESRLWDGFGVLCQDRVFWLRLVVEQPEADQDVFCVWVVGAKNFECGDAVWFFCFVDSDSHGPWFDTIEVDPGRGVAQGFSIADWPEKLTPELTDEND